MSVLVLADHDLGVLSPATARVVHAAAELGPVDILVAGEDIAAVAQSASTLVGVAKVLTAQGSFAADSLETLLSTLTVRYHYVVASASSVGKDVIPRLAARLDIMPVTDITAILGPNRFERPIYAGNALQTVTSNQPKHILTLRASAFRAAATGNAAPIEPIDASGIFALARVIASHRTQSDTPDLATAQIVVGGGIAVGSADGFQLIESLAKKLGAAVGATRAAVDAGYAPNDWQVGQTGKIIAPELYIAVGISGAVQHLAGMKDSRVIVAINKDPDAPIFQVADYGIVADLFDVLPALEKAL